MPRGRGYNSSSSSSGGGGGIYRARGRPYAAVRGGGRAGFVPVMRLDNRTKRVAVTIPDMKGDKEEEFRHYLIVRAATDPGRIADKLTEWACRTMA